MREALLNLSLQLNMEKDKMRLEKSFILGIFAFIILLSSLSFVSLQEETQSGTEDSSLWLDLSKLLGLGEEGTILGKGIKYQKVEGDGVDIFFTEENATLKIADLIFENISTNYTSYIKIGLSGEIQEADFFVNENGGVYTFAGSSFCVPPNSRVLFDGKEVRVYASENSSLAEVPIFDISKKIYPVLFKGENLVLKDGMTLKNGFVSFRKEGILLEKGTLNYKQMLFDVSEKSERVLIADADSDLSDYSGNWVKLDGSKLRLQTSEKGKLSVRILGSNEIFNTDDKDKLMLEIGGGDGLLVENRNEEGLIPSATHLSSESGESKITNGNFVFKINKDGIFVDSSKKISFEEIKGEAYQTAALEIGSTADEEGPILRVNAYNQMAFIDKNNRESVVFDKYDLPISNLLKDNQVQTLDHLRKKYPQIEFVAFVGKNGSEKYISASFVHVVDSFFERYPHRLNDVKKIVLYPTGARAAQDVRVLFLGRDAIDYTTDKDFLGEFSEVREVPGPLNIILHESSHAHQEAIKEKEERILAALGDPEINEILNKREKLREQASKIVEEKYGGNPFATFGDPELRRLIKEIEDLDEELLELQWKKGKGYIPLQQFYNEMGVKGWEAFDSDEGVKKLVFKVKEDALITMEKKVDEFLKIKIGMDAVEYVKRNKFYEEEELNRILEDVRRGSRIARRTLYFGVLYDLKKKLASSEVNSSEIKALKPYKDFFTLLFDIYDRCDNVESAFLDVIDPRLKSDYEAIETLEDLYAALRLIKPNNHEFYENQLDQAARTVGGVPYLYSFRDYSPFDIRRRSLDKKKTNFAEIATTYIEQPVELRKSWIQSGLPKVRDAFKKLTQLAFDSGELPIEEYVELMGPCKRSDCLDKRCVEYKLVCCQLYPDSPNC